VSDAIAQFAAATAIIAAVVTEQTPEQFLQMVALELEKPGSDGPP
jgi:hypothetical protein